MAALDRPQSSTDRRRAALVDAAMEEPRIASWPAEAPPEPTWNDTGALGKYERVTCPGSGSASALPAKRGIECLTELQGAVAVPSAWPTSDRAALLDVAHAGAA